jgi:hypothetical protein
MGILILRERADRLEVSRGALWVRDAVYQANTGRGGGDVPETLHGGIISHLLVRGKNEGDEDSDKLADVLQEAVSRR